MDLPTIKKKVVASFINNKTLHKNYGLQRYSLNDFEYYDDIIIESHDGNYALGYLNYYIRNTDIPNSIDFIYKTQQKEHQIIFRQEPIEKWNNILNEIPRSILSAQLKKYFYYKPTKPKNSKRENRLNISLPWKTDKTYRVIGGPHSYLSNQLKKEGYPTNAPWNAIDIAGYYPGSKVEVMCVLPGIVLWVKKHQNIKCQVIIGHKNAIQTSYFHLDKIAVKQDDKVEAGDLLGFTSNKLDSKIVPHVHFAILKDNKWVDIAKYNFGGYTISDYTNRNVKEYEGHFTRKFTNYIPIAYLNNYGTLKDERESFDAFKKESQYEKSVILTPNEGSESKKKAKTIHNKEVDLRWTKGVGIKKYKIKVYSEETNKIIYAANIKNNQNRHTVFNLPNNTIVCVKLISYYDKQSSKKSDFHDIYIKVNEINKQANKSHLNKIASFGTLLKLFKTKLRLK